MLPKNIDHLIYTVPDLEQGMRDMEALLGTAPVIGGRHPKYGTHNAILSLGPGRYLEIMAPDPGLPEPEQGLLFEDHFKAGPKLTTWVMRAERIEALWSHAAANGLQLGKIEAGKRERPDGTVLYWKLTDPYAVHFDGALPFLIDWGNTPHPSGSAPYAGELVEFRIEHPEAEFLKTNLELLGAHVPVFKAGGQKLAARIRTENGIVSIS